MRNTAIRTILTMAILASSGNLQAQEEGRKLILHPDPVYPEAARKFALSGVVKVQVLIAADGHVKEVKVIGGHPLLVSAVESTVKSWRYAPATSESTTTLEFHFHPSE